VSKRKQHPLARLGLTLLFPFQTSIALGQDQHAPHPTTLPIVVNGAEAPDNIPDHLAYAHFIIALSQPDSPSAEQANLRDAMLKPLQLSHEDKGALIAALRGVHAQLAFVAREVERLSYSSPESPERSAGRLNDLRLRRTWILGGAQARLTANLNSDGLVRLDDYIKAQVKPRIIIYGDAPK